MKKWCVLVVAIVFLSLSAATPDQTEKAKTSEWMTGWKNPTNIQIEQEAKFNAIESWPEMCDFDISVLDDGINITYSCNDLFFRVNMYNILYFYSELITTSPYRGDLNVDAYNNDEKVKFSYWCESSWIKDGLTEELFDRIDKRKIAFVPLAKDDRIPMTNAQIEQNSKCNVAKDYPQAENYTTTVSDDKIHIMFSCDQKDFSAITYDILNYYAWIVSATPYLGDLYVDVYIRDENKTASLQCKLLWAKKYSGCYGTYYRMLDTMVVH